MFEKLIGEWVTITTEVSNVPVSLENTRDLFCGKLLEIKDRFLVLEMVDETLGIFNMDKVISVLQNKVVSSDDPEYEEMMEQFKKNKEMEKEYLAKRAQELGGQSER